MSAYLIVNVAINNHADYQEYKDKVPALIRKHGGEHLVRGGNCIVLEGDWHPSRLVILRFPDIAAVQNLFNDAEYQPLKALRQRVTESEIVVVEGTYEEHSKAEANDGGKPQITKAVERPEPLLYRIPW